ncbi:hypothetical protein ABK040_000175 [Willaertia magna]
MSTTIEKEIQIAETRVVDLATNKALAWEKIDEKGGSVLEYAPPPPHTGSYRVTYVMNGITAEKVLNTLWDNKNVKAISDSLIEIVELKKIGDDAEVVVHPHKSPAFGVSKRDYLIVRKKTVKEDGTCVLAQKSIVDNQLYGEQSGFIRGDLLCSGYVIKPIAKPTETIASSCHVTYVIQTDVKGWIPDFVKKMANKVLIDQLSGLEKYIKKNGN